MQPRLIDRARTARVVAQAISRIRIQHSQPTQGATAPTGRWHALPGGHLELACTGWQITLARRQLPWVGMRTVYVATNPEGDEIGATVNDLQALKSAVEKMAADRQEFNL